MRLRHLALLFCLAIPSLALTGCSNVTTAEQAANAYATDEMAAAPVGGNLPDYSLSPSDLAKAQHLETTGTVLNFAGTLWSIVQILILLWLGVIAWVRDRSIIFGAKPFLQTLMYPFELLVFTLLIDVIPAAACFLIPNLHVKLLAEVLCLVLSAVCVFSMRVFLRRYTFLWVEGFTFFILYTLIGFLCDLPLALYGHYLQLQYGLSVQHWGSWFWDQAKGMMLSLIFGGLVVMLLFWVIRKFPRRWWLVFWGCTVPLIFLVIFAGPYIGFLFNKYEPLQKNNPELVAQLERVVEKGHMGIPPERMYLMKASEKVTTLNADVEGFGASKRVVVWDNTITKLTTDEVTGVFGHESGHYVLGHINRGIAVAIGFIFVMLWLGFLFIQWALARFGARWRIPSQGDWGSLAVLSLAFGLFGLVLQPLTNTMSRSMEHAADVYGQEAIHGIVGNPSATMQGAFQVLGTAYFAVPNPSPLHEFWLDSHPSIGRRAAFAHAYDPWVPGYMPKYFRK